MATVAPTLPPDVVAAIQDTVYRLPAFDTDLPAADGSDKLARALDCYVLPNKATTAQILADLGGYIITLWVFAGLVVVLLYGLLARMIVLIYRDERIPKPWRAHIIWANSIYPFVSLMCLGSLIVPNSDSLLNAVGVIYMSIAVSKFVDLCLLYFGGESKLLTSIGDIDVPLASPPLCCCCVPCCPRRKIGKRILRVIKLLVHQLPYSQSGYFFFALYLLSASVLEVGHVSGDNSLSLALTLMNAASFLLGSYGLAMLGGVTHGQLPHLHFKAKYTLMKSTLVIIKVQELIFNIAISNGGVSCTPSMSPKVYGGFIQNIVLVLEMLVFGLLTHWVYQRADEEHSSDVGADDQDQGTSELGKIDHGTTDNGKTDQNGSDTDI